MLCRSRAQIPSLSLMTYSGVFIQHAAVAVNLEGAFEFTPDQHVDVHTLISPEGHVDLDRP